MKSPTLRISFPLLVSAWALSLGACQNTPTPTAAPAPVAATITLPANVTASLTTGIPARTKITSGVIDTTKLRATPNATGSSTYVFNGPSGTLENFESHITTVNPGQFAHLPHIHAHEEMLIVKEGTLEVYIAGKVYVARPGSIIFYGPSDPHGTKNIGDIPATYYVFSWKTDQTSPQDTTRPAGVEFPE